MMLTLKASHENGGWRGQVIDADGKCVRRTANVYPHADQAIAAAERQRDLYQEREAMRRERPLWR
jgi:mannose/cellobiose epimerase-like protein (N-acyl-D-glucosamine 2-epimerase family)